MILKICLVAFGIFLAKLIPDLLKIDWIWLSLIFAITCGYLIIKMIMGD